MTEPVSAYELNKARLALVHAFHELRVGHLLLHQVVNFTDINPTLLINLGWLREEPTSPPLYVPGHALADNKTPGGTMDSSHKNPTQDAGASAGSASAEASTFQTSLLPTPASAPAGVALFRADQVQELGRMREALTIVSEEIKDGWQLIVERQQQQGWPDIQHVKNETFQLLKLSSALHEMLLEYQLKLAWAKPSGK